MKKYKINYINQYKKNQQDPKKIGLFEKYVHELLSFFSSVKKVIKFGYQLDKKVKVRSRGHKLIYKKFII
ncbi:hypothetical protein BpHYR1_009267 [Brachionus plicatilis]|uniref:Uncharacterized protein n=1 Tax=Brachionus plicatilis TaxID=10195 RepID=A0A3M7Q6T6_BRAPC|nr:hypothetical protein BpHYR1_009267 [Brachionus plicatilis]